MTETQDYICHERFSGKDMRGVEILIRRGDHLVKNGDLLYYKDEPVCVWRSLNGKKHFAVNTDGKGLERGELTHRLAYAPRDGGEYRFNVNEQKLIRKKYFKYLKPDAQDTILFNDDFFELDLQELRAFEDDLLSCPAPDGTETSAWEDEEKQAAGLIKI